MRRARQAVLVGWVVGVVTQLLYLPAAARGVDGRPADDSPTAASSALMPTDDPAITDGQTAPRGAGTEFTPKVGLRDLGPVPMPKVEPSEPGPVPMPEVEPSEPGPAPMPQVEPRPSQSTQVPLPEPTPTLPPAPPSLK